MTISLVPSARSTWDDNRAPVYDNNDELLQALQYNTMQYLFIVEY